MGPATRPPMPSAGFRRWRRTRPFWGGLGIVLGAAIVLAVPFVTLRIGELVVSLSTPGGSAATLVAAVLACCGGAAWWRPEFKTAAGVVAMIAALVAVVTTNLGGLIIGSLLAILGAAATLAWTPTPRSRRADPRS
jgi:hypothetical protein